MCNFQLFISNPLRFHCCLQFEVIELDAEAYWDSSTSLLWVVWSQRRSKKSAPLGPNTMASAPLWSLHVCQEVSLLGNFAPLLHLNYVHREAEKMSQWLRELVVLTAKLAFPVPRLGSSQLLIIPAPRDLAPSLPSKVAHSCNPRAGRNEADELQIWDKPELRISVPFLKLKKNKKLLSLGASFIKRCSLLVSSKFWFLIVRAGIK